MEEYQRPGVRHRFRFRLQGHRKRPARARTRPESASDQFARSHDRQRQVGGGHLGRRARRTSLPRVSARKLQEIPHRNAQRSTPTKIRSNSTAFRSHKYLKDYAPEVKQWWDGYGPSNYGAKSEDTSTLVAADELKDMAERPNTTLASRLPGGNAVLAQQLADDSAARKLPTE